MKKYIVKIVAMMLLVVALACCFTSCNKLSGVYVCQDKDDIYTTYEFSMFSDKLIVSYLSIPFEGTYEIDEDVIRITIFGGVEEYSYSKKGRTIYIDGVAFVKE